LADTVELIEVASPSHQESALASLVARRLEGVPGLDVTRVQDNVVARTRLGRSRRVILAGHLDTVPPSGNERAVLDGEVCRGLGAADMKGGLAVMARLARALTAPRLDVTFLFYSCEEVDARHSGLVQLRVARPDLLAADVAILGEPTSCQVEAGCQGNLRAELTLGGRRAHTARPWTGTNAIHRLGPVLEHLAAYSGREPILDGCRYREALQAVRVEGGVANNVVPDRVRLVLNHRYAPDRDAPAALAALREELGPLLDEELGDSFELVTASEGAPPGLVDPLLSRLVELTGPPSAKLGWTDVSFFHHLGLPATNFGPGDPLLAHTPGEWVSGQELEKAYRVLFQLLSEG
jgi:succinyl-diaminopimelate desuccinylase